MNTNGHRARCTICGELFPRWGISDTCKDCFPTYLALDAANPGSDPEALLQQARAVYREEQPLPPAAAGMPPGPTRSERPLLAAYRRLTPEQRDDLQRQLQQSPGHAHA